MEVGTDPDAMMLRTVTSCLALALAGHALAQVGADELPAELDGVGIVQKLDAQVPVELPFVDHTGRAVRLQDYLDGTRPVILTLNYYRCPMLCSLTLNGLVDGLRKVDLGLGTDYDIVTVSINPNEGPDLALQNRRGYVSMLGGDVPETAWAFLTGDEDDIVELADTVGFGYRYDEHSGEYAHTSSIMFLTPDGRVSKYMNDVRFNPRDMRLALVDASSGQIGSLMDELLLFNCFQWDPEAGSYVASAWKIMRLGGFITVILLVGGIIVLGRMGPRRGGGTSEPHLSDTMAAQAGGMQA